MIRARRLGLAAIAVVCLWPWTARNGRTGSVFERLLGPFASLAASVEWVRFDGAVRAGRLERAYALAERALALDPGATQGWIHLAGHLVRDRASVERSPSAAERRRWIRAGIAVLERGEASARDPEDLALSRGLAWLTVAELDEATGLGWPGGSAAAAREAIRALDRATALGHPSAARLAAAIRETWGS